MQQNNTSVASTRPASLLNHPISQATVTGALTLIPTRKYPTWLRHSLIWGPAVACLAGSVYLTANGPAARLGDSLFVRQQVLPGCSSWSQIPQGSNDPTGSVG